MYSLKRLTDHFASSSLDTVMNISYKKLMFLTQTERNVTKCKPYPLVIAYLFLKKMLHHVFEVCNFLIMKMTHFSCKHVHKKSWEGKNLIWRLLESLGMQSLSHKVRELPKFMNRPHCVWYVLPCRSPAR